ncbi:hypothetical protein RI367_008004 [Sorochytrium milnesiophthora]
MTATLSDTCCSLPPVQSDYTPKGDKIKIGELDVYTVGPKDAKHAILFLYDIYGNHASTYQTADLLSHGLNAHLVLPDYFGSAKPPMEKGIPAVMEWLADYSWDKLKGPTELILQHLKSHGAESIVSVGLCWGAFMAAQSSNGLPGAFRGVGMLHPSLLAKPLADAATAPWCVLLSKDEGDMSDVQESLKANPKWGDKVVVERFDDMHHGWCGSRGDFSNELNRQRTHEALQKLVKFYKSVL